MEEVNYKEGKVKAVLEKLSYLNALLGIVVTDPPDAVYIGIDSSIKPKWSNGKCFTILDVPLDAIKEEGVEHVFLVDKYSGDVHYISRKDLDEIGESVRDKIGRRGKEIPVTTKDVKRKTTILGTIESEDIAGFLKKSKEEEKYKPEIGFPFPHLHLHTEFSYLDGACKIKDLVEFAAGQGFKQLAITDHGNLNGWFRFRREAEKFGIHPIYGVEFYLVPNRRTKGLELKDRQEIVEKYEDTKEAKEKLKLEQQKRRDRRHVVVLAKNMNGIKKLYELNKKSFTEGFYYKPRIDYELLYELAPNVVVMTACLGGLISKLLMTDQVKKAVRIAKEWKEVFGSDFYLEIQPNEIPEQVTLNLALKTLGEELDIPLVATNDVHYNEEYYHYTHDVLICMTQMQERKEVYMDDPDRWRYNTSMLFLRSYEGMIKGFNKYHKDLGRKTILTALANAEKIANQITGKLNKTFDEHVKKIPKKKIKLGKVRKIGPVIEEKLLPDITIPDKYKTPNDYLEALCYKGWKNKIVKRVPKEKHKIYQERLKDELSQIFDLGFSEYFLVIYDLVHWALKNKILVGPGRGSVAGSLVAYLLGITLVDPIKWDLLFSRFISPDRIDFPDIDLDFPSHQREDIKTYLREKYGEECVASVANFAAMKGKMVIRDVARVHRVPQHEVNKVAQHIIIRPSGDARGSQCITDTFKEFDECRKFAETKVGEVVLRYAHRLEGQIRQKGVNAAGVVVAPKPLIEYIPIEISSKKGKEKDYITSWDRIDVEDAGLLKIDILGVDGLSYIQETVRKVKEFRDEVINLENIPLDDPEVYKALSEGNTLCVWQLASQGAVRTLRQLKPQTFEEIIATTALIRPGPLYSGMTARYVKAKHDPSSIKYPHKLLEPILNSTAGQCIYQEQATRIVHDFAGFDWAEADAVRKCISKKMGKEYMQQYYQKYLKGTEEKGVPKDVAKKMWNAIGQFGQYAFNRSHSAAYSFLSYWTCYLKIHYPLEFMSSVLTTEKDDENIRKYIKEARDRDVKVEPPNVNESGKKFEPVPERKVIVAGLSSIKGIGPKAVDEIINHRPYKSFEDFLIRVPSRSANKTVIEVLLKTGAFGSLVDDSKSKVKAIEGIVRWRKSKKKDEFTFKQFWKKYISLDKAYPEGEKYTDAEMTDILQDLVNFPLERHPIKNYERLIERRLSLPKITKMGNLPKIYGDVEFSSRQVWVIGVCTRVQYQSVAVDMSQREFEDRKEELGASDNLEGTRRRVKLNIDDGSEFVMLMTNPDQYAELEESKVKVGQVFLARGKLTGNYRLSTSYIVNLGHYADVMKMRGEKPPGFMTDAVRLLERRLSFIENVSEDKYVKTVKESNREKLPIRLDKLHDVKTEQTCWIEGRIMGIRRNISKKKQEYAYIDFEDHWASIEVFFPPSLWEECFDKEDKLIFRKGKVLEIRGQLRPKEEPPEDEEDDEEEGTSKKWYRRTSTFIANRIVMSDITNKLQIKVKKEKRKNVKRSKEEESKKDQEGSDEPKKRKRKLKK